MRSSWTWTPSRCWQSLKEKRRRPQQPSHHASPSQLTKLSQPLLPKPKSGDQIERNTAEAASGDQPQGAEPESAEAIFTEVGKLLLRQRELLGLSLEDIERHTHLRQHYLQALEAGDLEGLPSPVQARGMLNNYAAFLGMDPETLLLRFADGLQARLQAKRAVQHETPLHR